MNKLYDCHVIPKRPAAGDRGWRVDVYATNKAKAIQRARDEARMQGAYDRLDGGLNITATEVTD